VEPRTYLRHVIDVFQAHYRDLGYQSQPGIPISSRVDPTVRLIGSHISVLKPFVFNGNIPRPGVCIVQNCIRTHSLRHAFNDGHCPKWGSYFPSLGALLQGQDAASATRDLLGYLKRLGIDTDRVLVRVSSSDMDLLEVCATVLPHDSVEVNTRPPEYYRHSIGEPEVSGRNFNIAVHNAKTNTYEDVGNIIHLTTTTGCSCIETAVGASVLTQHVRGLAHVLDCHPVPGLTHDIPNLTRKLQDSMLVSIALFREGLRPGASSNRARILRSYIRVLVYLAARLNIDPIDLERMMTYLEIEEFRPDAPYATLAVLEYARSYVKILLHATSLTEEDATVKAALVTN
jgi:hypothetical protein